MATTMWMTGYVQHSYHPMKLRTTHISSYAQIGSMKDQLHRRHLPDKVTIIGAMKSESPLPV